MKKLIQKVAAGAAVVAAALLLSPSAAMAAPYPDYSGVAVVGSTPALVPGGTVGLTIGGWTPGENVRFTLTGENGAGANLAIIKTAVSTSAPFTTAANGAGQTAVSITLPADASCRYTLQAQSNDRTGTQSWPLDVPGCLAETGAEQQPMLMLWAGAGALALVGGGLVVAGAVRKQRKIAA